MKILLTICLALASVTARAQQAFLHIAVTATSGVHLAWTASPTAGSTVNVYRCAGVGCTAFTKIATAQAAAGPYLDTTAVSGSYSYYVTAFVPGPPPAESVPSNIATVTIVPLPPTGLTAQ